MFTFILSTICISFICYYKFYYKYEDNINYQENDHDKNINYNEDDKHIEDIEDNIYNEIYQKNNIIDLESGILENRDIKINVNKNNNKNNNNNNNNFITNRYKKKTDKYIDYDLNKNNDIQNNYVII